MHLTLLSLQTNTDIFANSADPDEMAILLLVFDWNSYILYLQQSMCPNSGMEESMSQTWEKKRLKWPWNMKMTLLLYTPRWLFPWIYLIWPLWPDITELLLKSLFKLWDHPTNTIIHTVFDLITTHTPISAQSRNSVVFRLQPVYFFS